jgi:hypothetical protein
MLPTNEVCRVALDTIKLLFRRLNSILTRAPTTECSIPPLSDQPAALVYRHPVLLDRFGNRALLIWSVIDEADELGRRAADVVDGPRVPFGLFGWSLVHRGEG